MLSMCHDKEILTSEHAQQALKFCFSGTYLNDWNVQLLSVLFPTVSHFWFNPEFFYVSLNMPKKKTYSVKNKKN